MSVVDEFTTKGRLARGEFFSLGIMLFFAKIIVVALMTVVWFYDSEFTYLSMISGLIALILFLLFLVGDVMITIRRLHDFNRSGNWALLLFIPYIDFLFILVLLVIDGTTGPNKYGPDPKGRTPKGQEIEDETDEKNEENDD